MGALTEGARVPRAPGHPEIVAQVDRGPAEPPSIVELPGQNFRFAEVSVKRLESSEGQERVAEVEAKVDGLLDRLPALREVTQRGQRLLETGDGLAIARARERLGPGLTQIAHRLVPQLGAERVVG